MKIRSVRAEFHVERQRERHDKADSRYLQFSERASKYYMLSTEGISISSLALRTKSGSLTVLQATGFYN